MFSHIQHYSAQSREFNLFSTSQQVQLTLLNSAHFCLISKSSSIQLINLKLTNLINSADSAKLKNFWPELENYFTKQQFRELLSQKATEHEYNVLSYATKCEEIEFHEN